MLICHKLVASNGAAVLQACHMSDVHATLAVSIMPVSRVVVCLWAPHPVLFITSGFSNTITRQRCITTTAVARRSCGTHENCMHAEQIIIFFYIYFFYFLFYVFGIVLFSIVLYRTIVTVHTDNTFLYNYLQLMHQIIHLSPVGCFTPARGKSKQKNRDLSGVNNSKNGNKLFRQQIPILRWKTSLLNGHSGQEAASLGSNPQRVYYSQLLLHPSV